jgi:hypothetical protein
MATQAITNTAIVGGEKIDNRVVNSFWPKVGFIREKVATAAAANVTLRQRLPKNSRVIACQMNFDTAITLASSGTRVALGITGDPDSLLLSTATVTKNTKVTGAPLTTNFAATETAIIVASTDNAGAALGTMAGTVSVQLVYIEMPDLADAP